MIRQLNYWSRKAYLIYPFQVFVGALLSIVVSSETLNHQKRDMRSIEIVQYFQCYFCIQSEPTVAIFIL